MYRYRLRSRAQRQCVVKLHSNCLSAAQLEACLADMKRAGRVDADVRIDVMEAGSRQRQRAWEVRLSWHGVKRPGDGRRRPQGKLENGNPMCRNLIAALAALAAVSVAAVLGSAPAHADECFLPGHHWDGSRGYCVPDSYAPPPYPNYQHPRGWYNTNP